MSGRDDALRDSLVFPVALTVMAAWIVSLTYAVLSDSFVPLTITTPVMLVLSGYCFGTGIVKSSLKGKSGDE
jgi:hypothetical protein